MNTCNAEHQQMVEDCVARESRLTGWEREFVESVQSRLASGRPLSDKQAERLDEIWERVTSKGIVR